MLNKIQDIIDYFIKATEGEYLWDIFKYISLGILGYLAKLSADYFRGAKKYNERNLATNEMLNDIEKSETLKFFGVSNTSLHTYLGIVFSEIKNKKKIFSFTNNKLPWNEIEICFASDEIGIMWENEKYTKNTICFDGF